MARTTGSHAGITGPRIDAAALHLIARFGFAAVSMRQIAAEVGVQAGALYNYTPDKQSLLARLMMQHMQDILAASDVLTAQTPVARLQEFVRFHIEQNHMRSDAVFVAYMELRNLNAENFADVENLRNAYEAKLEDILTAGLESGDFVLEDSRIATRALIAMLNGVNTWFREGGALSLDAVQSVYWDLVRKAVSA